MDNSLFNNIYQTTLTDTEFNKLSNFIQSNYGIKMPPAKKVVLQGRLQKRLKYLKKISKYSMVELSNQ